MAKAGENQESKKRARLMALKDRSRLIESFGNRFRELLAEKGMSQAEFATKSGIDAGNFAKYSKGQEPGLVMMALMAKALDVDLKDLVDFEFDFEIRDPDE